MLRRLGPRKDGGAGAAEYAGLIVLAALIIGALVALGLPAKVETGVSSAICQIFQGKDCGKPEAGGPNDGQSPGTRNPDGGPTNGQNTGGQNPNGNEPSLADLQKNADDAQKAADDANGKYGNIKQQIIDLLKDFIGITDIEECITKGSISSCLWAAFDVASWVFAALKIAKFAKAVKDAIKLWKVFNKGRKIIERTRNTAKRTRELLKSKILTCARKAKRGCGVWERIEKTQPDYPGTNLPRSFNMTTESGKKFWIHPNATKHIEESLRRNTFDKPIKTQAELESLTKVVGDVSKDGIPYDKLIVRDGWEIKIGRPKGPGQNPVVYHARRIE